MSTNDPVRIGVIGAGRWGMNIIRNVAQSSRTELAAVCDSSADVRGKLEQQYPGTTLFDSIETMLSEGGLQGVIVATPAARHHACGRQVLEAGLPAMVEKPLATTSEDAADLVKLSREKKVPLLAGHTFLYNNIVREVKRIIDSGDLGEIYYIAGQRLNLGQVQKDVDVLWNLVPHDITISNYWLDGLPEHVSAQGLSFVRKEEGIADICFCLMEYAGGASSHLHASWIDPVKTRRMVVVGSKKMLVYDDGDPSRHIQIYDKSVEKEYVSGTNSFSEFRTRLRAGDLVIPNITLQEPLRVEIEHFADCILGRAEPRTGDAHGLEIVTILESLSRSMKENGRRVRVEYTDPAS